MSQKTVSGGEGHEQYVRSSAAVEWRNVLGLHHCFGNGGGEATGVFSMSSCQNLPPCPAELLPADSKKDVLMVEAGPIRSVPCDTIVKRKREKKKNIALM